MNWLNVPKKVYFKRGSMAVALKELSEVYGFKSAFIVSDAQLYRDGIVSKVNNFVSERGIRTCEFFSLDAIPSFENIRNAMPSMHEFKPDVIIGVGGSAAMSAAKAMWMLYENPDLDLKDASKKFNAAKAGDTSFPKTGEKTQLVLVSTKPGSGAECTPYSVLADDSGKKCVIAGYNLLPLIAVIDADFALSSSPEQMRDSGLTVLTQAVRAYLAPNVTDYVKGFCKDAVLRVIEDLPTAVAKGSAVPEAVENIVNASTLAGMAIGNAQYTIDPEAVWYPTHDEKSPDADTKAKIVELAKAVGIFGKNDDELFDAWIDACTKLHRLKA
ncbi:MAG: iron-containing alcohol dehydrogenase [Anaerovoracaceae bacterium]